MPAGAPRPRIDTAATCLDRFLGPGDFAERHRRTLRAPADRVWAATLAVTPREIRPLMPLMAVRLLPRLVPGRRRPEGFARPADGTPILDVFEAAGFLPLHRDRALAGGHAFLVYGGVGRFWSPARNSATRLDSPEAFVAYRTPGMAKAAFSLEVVDHGTHAEISTETRVVGTDVSGRRAFGRYWLLIRGPSGLIRRGWLAAIDRRSAS
jgi:hypothetical protein